MKNIILIYILLSSAIFAGGIKEKVEREINAHFKNSSMEIVKYTIPKNVRMKIEKTVNQRFFRSTIVYWKIKRNNKLAAIAILDNVYGKTMPITFLVFFNLDGKILDSKVIKYRESHGGEISNKNWLVQFKNKDSKSSFDFGKDIDGISGATISAKSISKGIQKLSILAKIILDKL